MWNVNPVWSDNYTRFVKQALVDETLFETFKTNNDYVSIVGMSYKWQAQIFLDKIIKNSEIYNRINDFLVNDNVGSPELVNINGLVVSPNTLRHIQSLCYIQKYIGDLNNKIIGELGVGYGATALMIHKYYNPKTYHLLDLPDVQKFAKKYLNMFNINTSIEPPTCDLDIFISEFCWTEFDDEDMNRFYNLYIKKSKKIYIMSNLIDTERKENMLNYMREDFELTIIPETHGTEHPCYVIIGIK